MKQIIRDNLILIIGISLPIVLVIVFALATLLPKLWVASPQYDLVYVTYKYNTYNDNQPAKPISISVQNGKIIITQTTSDQNNKASQSVKLFIFAEKTQSSREISIPILDTTTNLPNNTRVNVPELQNIILNTSLQSPDGYTVYSQNQYGSDMSNLFFSSYDQNNMFVIKKDGNIIKIATPESYATNIRFLGWVISK